MRGTVSFYDPDEGFGFVHTRNFDDDLYFDERSFTGDAPGAGSTVKFERHNVTHNEHGLRLKSMQIRRRRFDQRRRRR